ncbi:MAG: hypothetical protein AAGD18_02020 [Actinomycetota bacterium]
MPARSNKQQAVVYYVKEHLASAGAIVTESKLLLDGDSGKAREVDVVVEYTVGDDPITISIEVIAWARRASVTWVEAMLSKHARMPTNRLVLVSWSGFSPAALEKVARQGGQVEALTPKQKDVTEEPQIRFVSPELTFQLVRSLVDTVEVEMHSETFGSESLKMPSNAAVFNAVTGNEIATLGEVVYRAAMAKTEDFSKTLWEARDEEEPSHYVLVSDTSEMGLEVEIDDVRCSIQRIRVIGGLEINRRQLDFEYWSLGPSTFAMTEASIADEPCVWVATRTSDKEARISWRAIA